LVAGGQGIFGAEAVPVAVDGGDRGDPSGLLVADGDVSLVGVAGDDLFVEESSRPSSCRRR
jgi:hypothetical protein